MLFLLKALRFEHLLNQGQAPDAADGFGSQGNLTGHCIWRGTSLALAHTVFPHLGGYLARSRTLQVAICYQLVCWFSKINWLTKGVGENWRKIGTYVERVKSYSFISESHGCLRVLVVSVCFFSPAGKMGTSRFHLCLFKTKNFSLASLCHKAALCKCVLSLTSI